jgi:hypothetical protein
MWDCDKKTIDSIGFGKQEQKYKTEYDSNKQRVHSANL